MIESKRIKPFDGGRIAVVGDWGWVDFDRRERVESALDLWVERFGKPGRMDVASGDGDGSLASLWAKDRGVPVEIVEPPVGLGDLSDYAHVGNTIGGCACVLAFTRNAEKMRECLEWANFAEAHLFDMRHEMEGIR